MCPWLQLHMTSDWFSLEHSKFIPTNYGYYRKLEIVEQNFSTERPLWLNFKFITKFQKQSQYSPFF